MSEQYKTSKVTSQATNKPASTLFLLPARLHEPMKFIQRDTRSRDRLLSV
jgi:hypothetical protein